MDDFFWMDGYRSATEYCFDEEQADAIVRTTAYHRRDYCLSMIWFSPREHIDIRPSIATPFPRAPSAGIGSLDRLPLELLFDTLYRLDMHSLFKFRQINLRARLLVDSLTEYQKVVSYGLNLFCALLRTRLITKVSLLDIYKALCTKTCRLCGRFGGFMSLIIWRRCCFRCIQLSSDTQVRTLASVRKYLRMTKSQGDRLRSFKSLPGIYSMNETVQKSRIRLVSLDEAIFTPHRWHLHRVTLDPSEGSDRIQKINFMGSCALPYYDKETDKVERGISCAGCQLSIERVLPAPLTRDGDTLLETKYTHVKAFWSIFGGANRHSFCGDRVMRAETSHLSFLYLLEQEATFEEENDHSMRSGSVC